MPEDVARASHLEPQSTADTWVCVYDGRPSTEARSALVEQLAAKSEVRSALPLLRLAEHAFAKYLGEKAGSIDGKSSPMAAIDAVRLFEAAEQRFPSEAGAPEIRAQFARALFECRMFEAAVEQYRIAIQARPLDFALHLGLVTAAAALARDVRIAEAGGDRTRRPSTTLDAITTLAKVSFALARELAPTEAARNQVEDVARKYARVLDVTPASPNAAVAPGRLARSSYLQLQGSPSAKARAADFHAQPYSDLVESGRCEWRVLPPGTYKLWPASGPSGHYDVQGHLGTCFMEAVIAAICQNFPELAEGLLVEQLPGKVEFRGKQVEVARYAGKFARRNEADRFSTHFMHVDAQLLFDKETDEVYSELPRRDPADGKLVIGPEMLKKVFAKGNDCFKILDYNTLDRGYTSLDDGGFHEALAAFTGRPACTEWYAKSPNDVEPRNNRADMAAVNTDRLRDPHCLAYVDFFPKDLLVKNPGYDAKTKTVHFPNGSKAKILEDGLFLLECRDGSRIVLMDDHAYSVYGVDEEGRATIRNPHANNPDPDDPTKTLPGGQFQLDFDDRMNVVHQLCIGSVPAGTKRREA